MPTRFAGEFWLIVGVVAVVGVSSLSVVVNPDLPRLGITAGSSPYRQPDALAASLVAGQILPVLWCRRFPRTAVLVCGAAFLTAVAFDYPPTPATVGVLISLYSAGAHPTDPRHGLGPDRWPPVCVTVVRYAALAAVLMLFGLIGLVYCGFFAAFWLLGRNSRREWERLFRLRVEMESATRQAVATERGRIATELHDIVAHNIGVITMQAGVARQTFDQQPGRAQAVLTQIEEVGRQGMGELRRLLQVLRTEAGPGQDPAELLAPLPGLGHLDVLVARLRRIGLQVALVIEGQPRELPPGVDLSAYRIVQESLTNALKHAGPTRATATIRYSAAMLELEIVNEPGPTTRRGRTPSGDPGHGLIGMRERAALFGGRLTAAPRPDGGFTVLAHLPTPTS